MSDGNHMFEKVLAFHRKHGHDAPETFTPMSRGLARHRLELMLEELEELANALGFLLDRDHDGAHMLCEPGTEEEVLDGLSDLLYVVLGTSVAMGVRDSRFFDEVHRSNMTKPMGRGRLEKPAKDQGFEPPRLGYLLDRMKGQTE